jgi:hypothetical protein
VGQCLFAECSSRANETLHTQAIRR